MTPKFRLFDKNLRLMLDVHVIDFYERSIECYADDLGVNRQEVYSYEMDENNYALMKSAGLTDKNGKEIFEGDVVIARWWNIHGDHERVTLVEWDVNKLGWNLINKSSTNMNYEIIGNVHEHSGLLKENGE